MASRHLLNPLAPRDEPTPSSLDGIDGKLERDLRAYGSFLIRQVGVMIKTSVHLASQPYHQAHWDDFCRPQIVTATAQTLFQRFWFVSSMRSFPVADTAAGALFLASKLEETPMRIRDIINSFAYIDALLTSTRSRPSSYDDPAAFTSYEPMDYFATEFYDRKDAIVIAEMQILKRLGFHIQCGLPYGHLANYCQVLELAHDNKFVKQAWGHLNDMFHTDVPAKYPQSTLACVAIYLVARKQNIALPLDPVPWWQLFDATETEMIDILDSLYQLYQEWAGRSIWHRIAELPTSKSAIRETIRPSSASKASIG